MVSRRGFLRAGGLALAGLAAPGPVRGALAGLLDRAGGPPPGGAGPVVIRMRSDRLGSKAWFDPVGVLIEPRTTVRWVIAGGVHSTTAYHPAHGGRPLRIPEGAEPWDSGILTRPGESFEAALTVPGVYDYFCLPHEAAGMVGRIVVAEPGVEPGTGAPDRPAGPAGAGSGRAIPEAALRSFPEVERIVREKVVRLPD